MTLSGVASSGTFADGTAWVVGDDPVVVAIDPPPSSTADGPLDGYQINPIAGAPQSLDGRFAMGGADHTPPPALPLALPVDGAFVTGTSQRRGYASAEGGALELQGAITRLASTPPATAFAPPVVRWTGMAVPAPEAIDVAAWAATLPSFDGTGIDVPPMAALKAKVCRFAGMYPLRAGPTRETYGSLLPTGIGDDNDGGNYGERVSATLGAGFVTALLDTTSTADRVELLTALVSMGRQWAMHISTGPNAGTNAYVANGGIQQFQLLALLCYFGAAGREADLAPLLAASPLNQTGNCFRWSQGLMDQLDPHPRPDHLSVSRWRQVGTVNGLNLTVSIEDENNTGDKGGPLFQGCIMTRQGDGATATVADMARWTHGTGWAPLTIDAHPGVPFNTGDMVYFQPQPGYEPSVGLADFGLEVYQWPQVWMGTTLQPYQAKQAWAADAIAARILAMDGAPLDIMVDYVSRCEADPLLPTHMRTVEVDGGDYATLQDFWDNHAAGLGL